MALRCHFDVYSSRAVHIDSIGDVFADIDEARRMSRALLLDFASHRYADGDECVLVCKIRTEAPERFYLTSLALLDEIVSSSVLAPLEARCADQAHVNLTSSEASEVLYRMSPDWSDLRELRSDGLLRDVSCPERAWFMDLIPREDRPRVATAIDRAIRSRGQFNLEHKIIRADKSIGRIRSRALPVVDEHGHISEWIGVAKDVTAKHAN